MYILLAFIAACAIGIGLHFWLPRRDLRGAAVTPAICTVAAGVVYTVLQWIGMTESNPLLWLSSIGGGLAIGVVATIVITQSRARRDAERAAELGIALAEPSSGR